MVIPHVFKMTQKLVQATPPLAPKSTNDHDLLVVEVDLW